MRMVPLLFLLLLSLATPAFSQPQSAKTEDLSTVLKEVFAKVRQYSLFKSRVNWTDLQHQVLDNNDAPITEVDFKAKVRLIFETIGDKHGVLFYKGERLGMDRSWTKQLRIPENQPDVVTLRTQLLEEGYGYMIIPPSKKYDNKTCQRYQDSLCNLGPNKLKGLVIDLRLQEGGSIYPLFAGLNQLYGNKYFGSQLDINENVYQKWTVDKGKYQGAQVNNHCKVGAELKIVVLTSQITASAGEMMAVALKGRPNTLFIGEPTAGFTTMNMSFIVSGYELAVAASVIADRNGKVYRDNVLPDITMVKGDNFINLPEDTKVIAALKWMKGK